MNSSFDYSQWTGAELRRAETTASQFLAEKQQDISRAFSSQCAALETLVAMLRNADLTLEEKRDCFARIAEVSEGIQDCAKGFFELGSQPLVARVLAADENQ
jgi:hypothetical protein